MECISHAARRLVLIVPTLLGASGLMFVLTMLIPGDPALVRLGNFATAEQLQSLRQEMGLTRPPLERYGRYVLVSAHDLEVVVDMHQDLFGRAFGHAGAPAWASSGALASSFGADFHRIPEADLVHRERQEVRK